MNTDDIDSRLTALEVKASFADDMLEELNQTIFRQQQQIDLLVRELARLREQAAQDPANARATTPRDEIPPHY